MFLLIDWPPSPKGSISVHISSGVSSAILAPLNLASARCGNIHRLYCLPTFLSTAYRTDPKYPYPLKQPPQPTLVTTPLVVHSR
ncbi:hypothetical protein RSAG8_12436, partial [Rhizoctonia solani AG-8 WAC10335]